MPFAQNALRKLRQRFISRASSKQDDKQSSLTPTPSQNDVYTLPTTEGLNRQDALVDNLADNLERVVIVHKSLDVAATVLNGVDAWLPLLGASLVLAKEGIEAVQASKALKHSAHAYISHTLRLIDTIQQKLKRVEESGEKMDPRDIRHFENFKGLLRLNLKTLRKITQMSNTQAWFGLKNAEDDFRRMQLDIESYASWLSLKASYDIEEDNEEVTRRMAQDRKESQLWAQRSLRDGLEMKKMLADLGQKADQITKMVPEELKSLRADIQTFRRRSQNLEADATVPTGGQPTIHHATTTVVYWAEELGNQIVWRAARIETLLSAHKMHCQEIGSSLVVNDIMANALTDLVKLFDDSCPPGLVILDKVPKLSASTSTKASSTQLKSPIIATPDVDKEKAFKRSS